MTRRFVRSGAFAACALLCASVANAAYQQMTPPAGVSTGTGSDFARLMMKPVAPSTWQQNMVRANAALNVGGRSVQVPVALKLAADAPRFMARAAFAHPALLAGAIAAPYLLEWARTKGYSLGDDPLNPGGKFWKHTEENYGKLWKLPSLQIDSWHVTPGAACSAAIALRQANPGNDFYSVNTFSGSVTYANGMPQGCQIQRQSWATQENRYYYTDYFGSFVTQETTSLESVPAEPKKFEDDLAGVPLPVQVPGELSIPLPVSPPVVNPSSGSNPSPLPLTIPLGDPVPVPNTDPQQYKQPVADVIPSPTAKDPWRVDVREGEKVTTDPEGVKDPDTSPDSPDAPEKEKEDYSFTDTGLPDVPDFYEQKYPDGISGVWEKHKAGMSSTSLMTFAGKVMPTGFGAGSCPQWSLPVDVGWLDAGSYDISIPCEIWQACKVIMLIGALLLARRLVFGG